MKVPRAAAAAIVALSACGIVHDRSVRDDLREESARVGLALVEARSERIAVIPFDGTTRYYKAGYSQPLTAAFGRNGTLVAWHRSSIWGPTELIVTSISGRVVTRALSPTPDFYPGAITEEAGLLEFWGTMPRNHRAGLYWAALDLSKIGFIDSLQTGDEPFGDWSPDGSKLVYSKSGVVRVFDMRSQRSTPIVRGRDPTWAPNGKWISFRGPDELAALITIDGTSVPWSVGRRKPCSPLRWSPDGRFVSFSERRHFPLLGGYYRVVICRVSDGRDVAIRTLGISWPDLLGFHWILRYREFCHDCTPSEPFS